MKPPDLNQENIAALTRYVLNVFRERRPAQSAEFRPETIGSIAESTLRAMQTSDAGVAMVSLINYQDQKTTALLLVEGVPETDEIMAILDTGKYRDHVNSFSMSRLPGTRSSAIVIVEGVPYTENFIRDVDMVTDTWNAEQYRSRVTPWRYRALQWARKALRLGVWATAFAVTLALFGAAGAWYLGVLW